MQKIFLPLIICFFSIKANAQNVGIGTTTPTSNLEVKKAIKSTIRISSNDYTDTSQLIFSNVNPSNLGTEMRMTNITETGIRFSSKSDITTKNKDTILQITPEGNVGVRTATPQYPLDVKGNMNVTGELRTNGVAGQEGQFLRSNGNGTMSWVGSERFEKFRVYRNDGTATNVAHAFSIPSGVTEVAVEIWGAGGQANTSGGAASGGYIYAIIPVSGFTSMTLNVGAGGGCTVCTGSTGYNSSVVIGGLLNLTCRGGYNSGFTFSQGTFTTSGSYLPNVSYFGVEGGSATEAYNYYENSPVGYFIFLRNGDGADAPFRQGTGGRSGWRRLNWDLSNAVNFNGFKGSEPGGGGGFPNGDGGNGQIIVYW
jgi:hypothetical protein